MYSLVDVHVPWPGIKPQPSRYWERRPSNPPSYPARANIPFWWLGESLRKQEPFPFYRQENETQVGWHRVIQQLTGEEELKWPKFDSRGFEHFLVSGSKTAPGPEEDIKCKCMWPPPPSPDPPFLFSGPSRNFPLVRTHPALSRLSACAEAVNLLWECPLFTFM